MIKKILAITISIFLALIIIEISMRALGIMPWKYNLIQSSFSGEKIFIEDSELGWISAEKVNLVNPNFKLTIDENGARKSGLVRENFDKSIIVIGGSFAQGWGVNDEETFSSKLEKKYSNLKVYNYGQGGYGTIQSLLLLKKKIQEKEMRKLVIYTFIDHHEFRNAARMSWLRTLATLSESGNVKLPYGTIGEEDQLLIKPPISNLDFPFKDKFSIITVLEKAISKNMSKEHFPNDRTRKKQQEIITKKAIVEMKNVANSFNTNFLIIMLDAVNYDVLHKYENFFIRNKINFVDCHIPLMNEMVIVGDYHPSPKAHSHYSECLYNYISKKNLLN